LPQAIAHLQAAVTRAPEFAAGWASLSLAHDVAPWYTTRDQRALLGDTLANMRIAAEHAIALEPGSALTLHAQANLARSDARLAEAEDLYRPCRSTRRMRTCARLRRALTDVGHFDDALTATRDLLRLDPVAPIFWWRLGVIGVIEDRRDLVDEARDRIRATNPDYRAGVLADFHLEFWQGRFESARTALAEATRFAPAATAVDTELFHWSMRDPGVDDSTCLLPSDAVRYRDHAAPRGDADLFSPPSTGAGSCRRYDFYFLVATPVAQPLLSDARTRMP
jgi:tetratricopeptide (TPR) repeat protein